VWYRWVNHKINQFALPHLRKFPENYVSNLLLVHALVFCVKLQHRGERGEQKLLKFAWRHLWMILKQISWKLPFCKGVNQKILFSYWHGFVISRDVTILTVGSVFFPCVPARHTWHRMAIKPHPPKSLHFLSQNLDWMFIILRLKFVACNLMFKYCY
jgi:hypothetical protein